MSKKQFTDEEIEAVVTELTSTGADVWADFPRGNGQMGPPIPVCFVADAVRLILEARAERDEAQQSYAAAAKLLEERSQQAQRFFEERNALEAELVPLRRLKQSELSAKFTEGTLAAGDAMHSRIAALEAELDEARERNANNTAAYEQGQQDAITPFMLRIAALEAENAELHKYDLRRATPIIPAERIAENERLRQAFEQEWNKPALDWSAGEAFPRFMAALRGEEEET